MLGTMQHGGSACRAWPAFPFLLGLLALVACGDVTVPPDEAQAPRVRLRTSTSTTAVAIPDLGTPGGTVSTARDINDLGEVVSVSFTASGKLHAFLWTERQGMRDLGTLPGGSFSAVHGISDLGQVVGSSNKTPGGGLSAVLWEVTPGT